MHILLIEDDEYFRFKVSRQIKKIEPNAKLTSCTNGFEASRLLSAQGRCAYDFIVMDHYLPGMLGTELVTAIKGSVDLGSCKLVMLTSAFDDTTRSEALLAGADAYLSKPVNDESLRRLFLSSNVCWDERELPKDLEHYHIRRRTLATHLDQLA